MDLKQMNNLLELRKHRITHKNSKLETNNDAKENKSKKDDNKSEIKSRTRS